MKRRTLRIVAAALAACLLAACQKAVTELPQTTAARTETKTPEEAEWAVYWYLCGSNLESGNQSATKDLTEILSEKLPQDAKVVIQTGGSRSWHSKGITADGMHRLTVENGKLVKQEKLPLENMGAAGTLSDFITYCLTEHPAKHTMLLMWDHGGGTLGGVSYDMNYNMDSIMLPELKEALNASLTDGRKFDIIGFDACLMSSIDMVDACLTHADYLLSSQQLEPVSGWDYKALAKELKNAGSLTATELAKSICDAYYSSCEREDLAEIATLSLIDLNTAEGVVWHYNEMIKSMFDAALQSDDEAASIRRAAYGSENYGANGKEIGYTDMVDLKGFASGLSEYAGEAFLSLIDSSVVYQVRGSASSEGCGISCYYPLDASLRSVIQYTQAAGSNEDASLFFKYMLSPEYSGAVEAYAGEQNVTRAMREMRYVASDMNLGDVEKSVLTMDSSESRRLSDVKVAANSMSKESGKYAWTEQGEIPCTDADYENGVFSFDGGFMNVYGDESPFATYIYSRNGSKVKCYSPAVIDGEDAVLLFTGDLETGEVISNGFVLGQSHKAGTYDPSGTDLNDKEPEFTEEEKEQFKKEFGREGSPDEMRNYILSERAVRNRNFASSLGRVPGKEAAEGNDLFVSNRVDTLKEKQEVTPLFKCSVTDQPVKTENEDGNAGWQEGKPIVIEKKTKFHFEKQEEAPVFNFTVTDAWGNKEITGSFEAQPEEEKTGSEPETEPESQPEPETVAESQTAATTAPVTTVQTSPAATTAAQTTAPVPEPTLPQGTEAPATAPLPTRHYYGGNDDDDDEPETRRTVAPTTVAPTTAAPTTAAPTTAAPTTAAPTTAAPTTAAPTTEAPTTEAPTTAPATITCPGCGLTITQEEAELNHQQLPCGNYECESGHSLAGCGHCTCQVYEDSAMHLSDGKGGYICSHPEDFTKCRECGMYYMSEQEAEHMELSCGRHYACDPGDFLNHDELRCGHYGCDLVEDDGGYVCSVCMEGDGGSDYYIRCLGCDELYPSDEWENHAQYPCGTHYACQGESSDEHVMMPCDYHGLCQCEYDSENGCYTCDCGKRYRKCDVCGEYFDMDSDERHYYDSQAGKWICGNG